MRRVSGDLGVGSGLGIRVLVGWVLAALLVARPGIWGVMDAGVPREACRKGSLGERTRGPWRCLIRGRCVRRWEDALGFPNGERWPFREGGDIPHGSKV